jgi:hypothetical protein
MRKGDEMKKTKGKCKHCGEPVRVATDGILVHDDVDEDPSAPDYGWVKCSGGDDTAELST